MKIKKVVVIGSGTMGSGIAAQLCNANIPVVLLGAVLEPDPDIKPKLVAEDIVEDKPPEKGCCFQGRCPRFLGDKCKNETPPWQIGDNGNAIRCHINIKDLEKKQNGN